MTRLSGVAMAPNATAAGSLRGRAMMAGMTGRCQAKEAPDEIEPDINPALRM